MVPSKGVTCLTSVSPVCVTSVITSCLASGTRVSFHLGSSIDEGVGTEGQSSMTNVCLD